MKEDLHNHIDKEHSNLIDNEHSILVPEGLGNFCGVVFANVNQIKEIIEPMAYAEAKKFLVKMVPQWKTNNKFLNEELQEALLEFGWELQGQNNVPVCNMTGRERLNKMFF